MTPKHLMKLSKNQIIYSTLHLIFLCNLYYYEGIPDFINIFIIPKIYLLFARKTQDLLYEFCFKNIAEILESL